MPANECSQIAERVQIMARLMMKKSKLLKSKDLTNRMRTQKIHNVSENVDGMHHFTPVTLRLTAYAIPKEPNKYIKP